MRLLTESFNMGYEHRTIAGKENQSLCVCQFTDLYLERTKGIRGQNSQVLLNFVKPHRPVSTPLYQGGLWISQALTLKHLKVTQQGQLRVQRLKE